MQDLRTKGQPFVAYPSTIRDIAATAIRYNSASKGIQYLPNALDHVLRNFPLVGHKDALIDELKRRLHDQEAIQRQ